MLPPAFSILALAVAEKCSIHSKVNAFSISQVPRTFTAISVELIYHSWNRVSLLTTSVILSSFCKDQRFTGWISLTNL
jgi:hypothetical protein